MGLVGLLWFSLYLHLIITSLPVHSDMFPSLYIYTHHSFFFTLLLWPTLLLQHILILSNIYFYWHQSFSLKFCIRLQQHVYFLTSSLLLMFRSLSLILSTVVHLLFKDIRLSLVFFLLCRPLLLQFTNKCSPFVENRFLHHCPQAWLKLKLYSDFVSYMEMLTSFFFNG